MNVKKRFFTMVLVVSLASASLTSCAGQFALFNRVVPAVGNLGGRWIGAVVFWIIGSPVIGITLFADVIIFNVIEFWTGSNPVAAGNSDVFIADNTLEQTDAYGNRLTAIRNDDGTLSLHVTKVTGEVTVYLLERSGDDLRMFDSDGILLSYHTVALGN